jgi:hypothetical protein
MFKSENIVATNGATHCKLKQGSSKIVFSIQIIEFTTQGFL